MAAALFQAGFPLGVTFKITGAGGFILLNVTAWDWTEKVIKLVTTHTGSAGIAWWLPGVFDGAGRVSANYDINNQVQLASPGVVAGAGGLFQVNLGTLNALQIPARIEEVHYASAVESLLKYDFSASVDGSQGTYVRNS